MRTFLSLVLAFALAVSPALAMHVIIPWNTSSPGVCVITLSGPGALTLSGSGAITLGCS